MGTIEEEVVEIDSLQKQLLQKTEDEEEEPVLYTASFQETEENFIKYHTVQWVLYSMLLILAWGIGFIMLLYIPIRRFILRKDIRSRTLYLTHHAIVYKVTRPVPFPCFGVLHKEKHVLLHSVADVVVEQGYLQSRFGVSSLRIENVGVRRSTSDDVKIQGIANPNAFRKAVMMRLSNMRNEIYSRQVSQVEDVPPLMMSPSKSLRHDSTPSGELLLLQKLEEVGSSVKRLQTLFEEQQSQTTESID
ncbi:hypothetical protein TanjilG_16674 [Lupinus angustifolius]|uniref:DUF7642 domain-containing protein n=1 Tax=Lupinus angustifolius TaxID=3871 RepID=A0A4P1QZD8_LUPAN|nr:PREDICTED: uncharacterized protein LOC109326132 [Lupinus angustifolius]XP_019414344.1 PREDICTED: uncharacterized protein LOC109326132 [Lupinus angustifolius]XP_019414345.1 PREDICTED: uncharacterized protein LOC109326132 [Lupinus angustifolius]OIV98347.1 hypothetical protein TanjilG_16674 [Lupinus angustifolius]